MVFLTYSYLKFRYVASSPRQLAGCKIIIGVKPAGRYAINHGLNINIDSQLCQNARPDSQLL